MRERKRPDQLTITPGEKTISEAEKVMAALVSERRMDKIDFSAYFRLIHREFKEANRTLIEKYKDLFGD